VQGLWEKPREGEDRAVEKEGKREVRIEGTEQDEERGKLHLRYHAIQPNLT